MGKKSPSSPDYTGAAEKQGESSKWNTEYQTRQNRIDQYTPFGNLTFDEQQYDANGMPVQGTGAQRYELNEVDQEILNRDRETSFERSGMANALLPGMFDQMSSSGQQNLPEWAGTPDVPNFYGKGLSDYGQAPQDRREFGQAGQAEYNPDFAKTNYDRNMSLLGPQMEGQTKALENKLRNQGLQPGTPAYDSAVSGLRTEQAEQTNRLAQDSIGRGNQEQQRQFDREMGVGAMKDKQRGQQFGEDFGIAEFFNSSRGQQVAEQLGFGSQGFDQLMRQQQGQNQLRQGVRGEGMQDMQSNLNMINALLSGGQVGMTQMPSYNPAGVADTTNYLGAAQAQGDFNNQAAATAMSPLNAAIGAAGMAKSPSDIRLKKNVTKIGDYGPLDIVSWTWNGLLGLAGDSLGFIAQQVQEFYPEHVVTMSNGYLAIDYDALLKEV